MVQAARERKQHEEEDDEELEDVHEHTTQRDLQRSQVGVHREHVDELQGTEDVGRGEHGLGHQVRIVGRPFLTGQVSVRVPPFALRIHLLKKKRKGK